MALFILCRQNSSSSTQIYVLALIALVFVCSFSYCSSYGFDKNFDGENGYRHNLPVQSSHHNVDAAEHPSPSKDFLLNLLLKSALTQTGDRHHRQYQVHVNNRRYVPQSFHAMRG
jgi:hypothetical protein